MGSHKFLSSSDLYGSVRFAHYFRLKCPLHLETGEASEQVRCSAITN
jgi:hypothetical protein